MDVFSVVNMYHDHLKFYVVCINGRRYVSSPLNGYTIAISPSVSEGKREVLALKTL